MRTSSFAKNGKTNEWVEKECSISVGYYTGNKWNILGTVTMNIAEFIDVGDVTKVFQLTNTTYPIESAKCEATFRVDAGKTGSLEKEAPRISRTLVSNRDFGSDSPFDADKEPLANSANDKQLKDLKFLLEDRDKLLKEKNEEISKLKKMLEEKEETKTTFTPTSTAA